MLATGGGRHNELSGTAVMRAIVTLRCVLGLGLGLGLE
jgi:hypothetical protein